MIPAPQALELLKEGNRRFVAGESNEQNQSHRRIENQEPFVTVLGCSDSRVPPEIVFDQGVGDIFAIRIAGNIVTHMEQAGAEFASTKFGTKLILVLGHTNCGAVQSTVEYMNSEREAALSDGMRVIVDQISESIVLSDESDQSMVVHATIINNVKNSVNKLRTGSGVLEELVKDHGVLVVGGLYHLDTGVVEFFE